MNRNDAIKLPAARRLPHKASARRTLLSGEIDAGHFVPAVTPQYTEGVEVTGHDAPHIGGNGIRFGIESPSPAPPPPDSDRNAGTVEKPRTARVVKEVDCCCKTRTAQVIHRAHRPPDSPLEPDDTGEMRIVLKQGSVPGIGQIMNIGIGIAPLQ